MESNNFRRHESVLKSVRGALIDKQVTFEHQSNLQAELSKIALALTHSRLCRDRLLWVSGGNYRPGAANVAFRPEAAAWRVFIHYEYPGSWGNSCNPKTYCPHTFLWSLSS